MKDKLSVDIQFASDATSIPPEKVIRSWISAAIGHVDSVATGSPVEVSVRIVDEDEGERLNRHFRGKNGPTNVLSFPGGDNESLPAEISRPLGDIVICGPVVEAEAAEQGKEIADHWAHLLVHGTLHLLGYDHEEPRDARTMEALERRILADRGVADPYTN